MEGRSWWRDSLRFEEGDGFENLASVPSFLGWTRLMLQIDKTESSTSPQIHLMCAIGGPTSHLLRVTRLKSLK